MPLALRGFFFHQTKKCELIIPPSVFSAPAATNPPGSSSFEIFVSHTQAKGFESQFVSPPALH